MLHYLFTPICSFQISALILENTFTSILDMAGVLLPFLKWVIGGSTAKGLKIMNFLVRSPWSTIDIIGQVSYMSYVWCLSLLLLLAFWIENLVESLLVLESVLICCFCLLKGFVCRSLQLWVSSMRTCVIKIWSSSLDRSYVMFISGAWHVFVFWNWRSFWTIYMNKFKSTAIFNQSSCLQQYQRLNFDHVGSATWNKSTIPKMTLSIFIGLTKNIFSLYTHNTWLLQYDAELFRILPWNPRPCFPTYPIS